MTWNTRSLNNPRRPLRAAFPESLRGGADPSFIHPYPPGASPVPIMRRSVLTVPRGNPGTCAPREVGIDPEPSRTMYLRPTGNTSLPVIDRERYWSDVFLLVQPRMPFPGGTR